VSRFATSFRRIGEFGPRNIWESLLLLLLSPLASLYHLASSIRVLSYRFGLFRSYKAGVPVISVGNLSVGGTGKTPVVDHIVRHLAGRGKRVAVVSRGYGGQGSKTPLVVCAGEGPCADPVECGDEPYLLARRNPSSIVIVSPRRSAGVSLATESYGADIVLLDDGFQHLAVRRDLDIVLLDSRRPFGNGRLIPAGILRESPHALHRADLILLTRDKGKDSPLSVGKPVFRSRHLLSDECFSLDGEKIPLSFLHDRKVIAFAGIASPEGFFASLREKGIDPEVTVPLPDHVRYDEEMVRSLCTAAKECDFMVTTEKDGVKLKKFRFAIPCCEVPMAISIEGTAEFNAMIEKVFL